MLFLEDWRVINSPIPSKNRSLSWKFKEIKKTLRLLEFQFNY